MNQNRKKSQFCSILNLTGRWRNKAIFIPHKKSTFFSDSFSYGYSFCDTVWWRAVKKLEGSAANLIPSRFSAMFKFSKLAGETAPHHRFNSAIYRIPHSPPFIKSHILAKLVAKDPRTTQLLGEEKLINFQTTMKTYTALLSTSSTLLIHLSWTQLSFKELGNWYSIFMDFCYLPFYIRKACLWVGVYIYI